MWQRIWTGHWDFATFKAIKLYWFTWQCKTRLLYERFNTFIEIEANNYWCLREAFARPSYRRLLGDLDCGDPTGCIPRYLLLTINSDQWMHCQTMSVVNLHVCTIKPVSGVQDYQNNITKSQFLYQIKGLVKGVIIKAVELCWPSWYIDHHCRNNETRDQKVSLTNEIVKTYANGRRSESTIPAS